MHKCVLCDGPMMSMGVLGWNEHFRCRNCGWEDRVELPKVCEECGSEAAFFNPYCGADICTKCGNHNGLARCFCGWSASGGDGYRELREMGEVIELEDY